VKDILVATGCVKFFFFSLFGPLTHVLFADSGSLEEGCGGKD
jgi:hypothetical protein